MHALVTGANGHLGFNLVQRLLQQGRRVRGSLRGPLDGPDAARLRALGPVELVRADIRDAAAMGAALQGVDRLFHVAAVYSV
ncbi:MAG: NAD-dependent epimerase/dehydratase family protein, partial [Rubrivivax sp.]|nr:NAD-dependent epimerase/dehydratase family protein [Rubrivivax sp.]